MHGEATTGFSIQSISKVFSLAMCLSLEGDNLWKRVGKEPSGTAFNSLVQLEVEKGIPRNPFINAGAIVMTDILLNHLEHPKKNIFVSSAQSAEITKFIIMKKLPCPNVKTVI